MEKMVATCHIHHGYSALQINQGCMQAMEKESMIYAGLHSNPTHIMRVPLMGSPSVSWDAYAMHVTDIIVLYASHDAQPHTPTPPLAI
nr:hypothetical protein Iba_chr10aCG1480 [Ipomoea batatas]GMD42903.1 hypothetical protein Iba_chr10cCG0180 [Ipomoea batatas]